MGTCLIRRAWIGVCMWVSVCVCVCVCWGNRDSGQDIGKEVGWHQITHTGHIL